MCIRDSPIAVLLAPVEAAKELAPTAVLLPPVVLFSIAPYPKAVLKEAVETSNAAQPTAVLLLPVVRKAKVWNPTPTLDVYKRQNIT